MEDDDRSKVCSHSGALSVVLYYLKEIEIINRVKMIWMIKGNRYEYRYKDTRKQTD